MERNDFFNVIQNKEYFTNLISFLDKEYQEKIIYPQKENIFKAFELTKLSNLKVVIFGQDPYSNPNEAHGLAFSVLKNTKLPPSLKNIFKEINIEFNNDINYLPASGDLSYLAKQGVLLLNTYLTVEHKKPLSHKIKEYETLNKDLLLFLNKLDKPIVFLLWGNFAKKYQKYLNNPKHLVLLSNHPSPLSANRGGWFNTNNFKKANAFLKKNGIQEINWIPLND